MASEEKRRTPVARRALSPWYYNKFFRYTMGWLVFLAAVYMLFQVASLMSPFFQFFSILFVPIVISLLFYYLLRPVVNYFEKRKVPRLLTIIALYILVAVVLILFFAYLVPILVTQISAIANMSVEYIKNIKNASTVFSLGPFTFNLEQEIQERLLSFLQSITTSLSQIFVDIIGFVTRVATIFGVIPFIVFYMLKEGDDLFGKFLKSFPESYGKELHKILKNIDNTLSSYITGLAIVSASIGVMLFVAYMVIGLNYALILSALALIATTIPFLGPFLAITPALLVGLTQGSWMTIKVAIVFIVIQQIESNVISPQIIGHRLNVHPVTIILLLLAAGSLYGLLGLIFATPIYAILKTLAQNLYKIYKLRYPRIKQELSRID